MFTESLGFLLCVFLPSFDLDSLLSIPQFSPFDLAFTFDIAALFLTPIAITLDIEHLTTIQ